MLCQLSYRRLVMIFRTSPQESPDECKNGYLSELLEVHQSCLVYKRRNDS